MIVSFLLVNQLLLRKLEWSTTEGFPFFDLLYLEKC